MTDEREHDELNACIDTIVSSGKFASTGDEGVDALARLAAGLRGLPSPEFRAGLSAELLPERRAPAWWPFRGGRSTRRAGRAAPAPARFGARVEPVMTWVRRNRPFAAAGGGYGLLAGTCCLSGAVARVLSLASAAAVSAFIQTALPYFVAVSIVGLAAWLVLHVVRQQALTLRSLGATLRLHGLAMGGAYGAVFGASMGLAAAMGLV